MARTSSSDSSEWCAASTWTRRGDCSVLELSCPVPRPKNLRFQVSRTYILEAQPCQFVAETWDVESVLKAFRFTEVYGKGLKLLKVFQAEASRRGLSYTT